MIEKKITQIQNDFYGNKIWSLPTKKHIYRSTNMASISCQNYETSYKSIKKGLHFLEHNITYYIVVKVHTQYKRST